MQTAPGTTVGQFVVLVFGHNQQETQGVAPSFLHQPHDPVVFTDRSGQTIDPGVTFEDIYIGKTQHTCTSLDAQGRSMYVSVMHRPEVCHLNQLSDVELYDVWLSAVGASTSNDAECSCCGPEWMTQTDHFNDMRLNAGAYQNIRHLHLKIAMPNELFFEQWKQHRGWLQLASHSPNVRLLRELKCYVEKKEEQMCARNDQEQWWVADRGFRLLVGLEVYPPRNARELEEMEERERARGSGGGGGSGSTYVGHKKKTDGSTSATQ